MSHTELDRVDGPLQSVAVAPEERARRLGPGCAYA